MKSTSLITYMVASVIAFSTILVGDEFDLSWHSIDSGGCVSNANVYELAGTIGQPDAGPELAGGTFQLIGGLRCAEGLITSPCPPDVNGDGVVDVLDLLAVLAAWGTADPETDVNDDGVVDILDLLAVLAAWGVCP